MQLQHLKYEQCPVCQAPVVAESVGHYGDRISVHAVNGQRPEMQKFLCGREHEWCTSFSIVRVLNECAMAPEQIRTRTRRAALKSAATKFVADFAGEATPGEKDALIKAIEGVRWPLLSSRS